MYVLLSATVGALLSLLKVACFGLNVLVLDDVSRFSLCLHSTCHVHTINTSIVSYHVSCFFFMSCFIWGAFSFFGEASRFGLDVPFMTTTVDFLVIATYRRCLLRCVLIPSTVDVPFPNRRSVTLFPVFYQRFCFSGGVLLRILLSWF